MRRGRAHRSATAWSAATSAALDRGDQAEQLCVALEAVGWEVRRHLHPSGHEVRVELYRDGLYIECFTGPTALSALVLATSWVLSDEAQPAELRTAEYGLPTEVDEPDPCDEPLRPHWPTEDGDAA